LWDDIIKQFLQHTDQTVLTSAIQAVNELTLNTSLANHNTAKLNELTESLFTSLRDAINGQDVSSMSIDDEEVVSIQAILFRLTLLGKSRDITEVMEDEEGGQSSGWEIVCAFAERGELPYKDEAKVCSLSQLNASRQSWWQIIEYAIQAVFLHLTWMFKGFTIEDKDDPVKILALNEKRDRAVEIFQKLALKELSNAPISVKRQVSYSIHFQETSWQPGIHRIR
jgi:cohesin complex subunit SA-1/2